MHGLSEQRRKCANAALPLLPLAFPQKGPSTKKGGLPAAHAPGRVLAALFHLTSFVSQRGVKTEIIIALLSRTFSSRVSIRSITPLIALITFML